MPLELPKPPPGGGATAAGPPVLLNDNNCGPPGPTDRLGLTNTLHDFPDSMSDMGVYYSKDSENGGED